MGFDFISLWNNQYRGHINNVTWDRLLTLARIYGWQPKGTEPGDLFLVDGITMLPDTNKFHGDYFSNGGQIVTREDALEIAGALEAALKDIPDERKFGNDFTDSIFNQNLDHSSLRLLLVMGHIGGIPYSHSDPLEYFAGEPKQAVIHFIEICRDGAFQMW